MQKWCPEPFDEEGSLKTAEAIQDNFEGLAPSMEGESQTQSLEAQFRSETGFIDPAQLMNQLTRDERAQVFDLVEQDVREEYRTKSQELEKDFEQKNQDAQNAFNQSLNTWATEFSKISEQEIKNSAAASARLAILLAEKIVRCQVGIDAGVLGRTLETAMFKIQDAGGHTVTVSPEEAEVLHNNPELLKKLNIASVEADRRIQQGGCRVKSGKMEWDATIESQLDSLGELVEEMITTNNEVPTTAVNPSDKAGSNEVE